jgi:hypothetical protein
MNRCLIALFLAACVCANGSDLASAAARPTPAAIRQTYAGLLDHLSTLANGRELMREMARRREIFGHTDADSSLETVMTALARLQPHAEDLRGELEAILDQKAGVETQVDDDQAKAGNTTLVAPPPPIRRLRGFSLPADDVLITGYSAANGLFLVERTSKWSSRKIIVLGDSRTGRSRELNFSRQLPGLKWIDHPSVQMPVFSPDGSVIYARSADPKHGDRLYRYDVRRGRALRPLDLTWPFDHFRISPDGRRALTFLRGRNSSLQLTDLATGRTDTLSRGVDDAFFSADSRSAFVHLGSLNVTGQTIDLDSRQVGPTYPVAKSGYSVPASIVNDESRIQVIGNPEHFYTLTNSDTGGYFAHRYYYGSAGTAFTKFAKGIAHLAIASDGRTMAVQGRNPRDGLAIFDLQTDLSRFLMLERQDQGETLSQIDGRQILFMGGGKGSRHATVYEIGEVVP